MTEWLIDPIELVKIKAYAICALVGPDCYVTWRHCPDIVKIKLDGVGTRFFTCAEYYKRSIEEIAFQVLNMKHINQG